MLRVKVSELKNQLSRFLKAVRRGEIVEVMDRKTPIARILPVQSGDAFQGESGKEEQAFFEEQVRLGVLKPGTGDDPGKVLKGLPPGKPGVLAALLEERRKGR